MKQHQHDSNVKRTLVQMGLGIFSEFSLHLHINEFEKRFLDTKKSVESATRRYSRVNRRKCEVFVNVFKHCVMPLSSLET